MEKRHETESSGDQIDPVELLDIAVLWALLRLPW
jgi:hypothetical protein